MSRIHLKMLHVYAEQLQTVILQRQFSPCAGLLLEQQLLYKRFNQEYKALVEEVDLFRTDRALYEQQQKRMVQKAQPLLPSYQEHEISFSLQ